MFNENTAGLLSPIFVKSSLFYPGWQNLVPIDIIENEVFKVREDLASAEVPLIEFSLEKLLNFKLMSDAEKSFWLLHLTDFFLLGFSSPATSSTVSLARA